MESLKDNILIKQSLTRNPRTEKDLCLYTPVQTLNAIRNNNKILNWHNYLTNDYIPQYTKLLLLFPCTANKPWSEGKTKSKNYQILYQILNKFNFRDQVSLHTISEPLGLIGEADYEKMPIYDNPGLFKWFVRKNSLNWSTKAFEECINILGILIGKILNKIHQKFGNILAFIKPFSTHEKMIKIAKEYSNLEIQIGPTIDEIGELKNKYVWLANRNVQTSLIKKLKNLVFNDN